MTPKQGPLALLHPGARVGPMLPPCAGKGTCSCSPPTPHILFPSLPAPPLAHALSLGTLTRTRTENRLLQPGARLM